MYFIKYDRFLKEKTLFHFEHCLKYQLHAPDNLIDYYEIYSPCTKPFDPSASPLVPPSGQITLLVRPYAKSSVFVPSNILWRVGAASRSFRPGISIEEVKMFFLNVSYNCKTFCHNKKCDFMFIVFLGYRIL